MNPRQLEFLAHDRIVGFQSEARDQRLVASTRTRDDSPSAPIRIAPMGALGRLRLILRYAIG